MHSSLATRYNEFPMKVFFHPLFHPNKIPWVALVQLISFASRLTN